MLYRSQKNNGDLNTATFFSIVGKDLFNVRRKKGTELGTPALHIFFNVAGFLLAFWFLVLTDRLSTPLGSTMIHCQHNDERNLSCWGSSTHAAHWPIYPQWQGPAKNLLFGLWYLLPTFLFCFVLPTIHCFPRDSKGS